MNCERVCWWLIWAVIRFIRWGSRWFVFGGFNRYRWEGFCSNCLVIGVVIVGVGGIKRGLNRMGGERYFCCDVLS